MLHTRLSKNVQSILGSFTLRRPELTSLKFAARAFDLGLYKNDYINLLGKGRDFSADPGVSKIEKGHRQRPKGLDVSHDRGACQVQLCQLRRRGKVLELSTDQVAAIETDFHQTVGCYFCDVLQGHPNCGALVHVLYHHYTASFGTRNKVTNLFHLCWIDISFLSNLSCSLCSCCLCTCPLLSCRLFGCCFLRLLGPTEVGLQSILGSFTLRRPELTGLKFAAQALDLGLYKNDYINLLGKGHDFSADSGVNKIEKGHRQRPKGLDVS